MQVTEIYSLVHGIGFVIHTDFVARYGCSVAILRFQRTLVFLDFRSRLFNHFHVYDVVAAVNAVSSVTAD